MKIAIVGAGAMGCYFAARLAESGNQVSVVDVDENRLDVIADQGIEVEDDGGLRAVAVHASTASRMADHVDLLVLFTKGMHSEAAAQSCRHIVGDATLGLTLQNGLGNDELLADVIPGERVVIGVTDVPADLVGPNRVVSHGKATINIGGYGPASTTSAARVEAILASAGFSVTLDEQVRIPIWEKVAFNAAMNAVSAITGCAVGEMDTPAARALIDAASGEVVATAHRLGIGVDAGRVTAKTRFALANHRSHKPSMLQDIEAGRMTEIESINGAVVRAAEAAGATAPVNATLAGLLRVLEVRRKR